MKKISWFIVMAVLPAVCAAALSFSFPQKANIRTSPEILRIRKIKGEKVETPEFQARADLNLRSRPSDKHWYQIMVEYDTKPEWMDQLDLDVYALQEDSGKKGRDKYKLLQGRVSYINVEEGSHVATLYIHPHTLERFGDVERIAVIIRSKGQVLGIESDPSSRTRWWEQLSPTKDLLLSRIYTPFAWLRSDNFEAIKHATPSR
jgi:hypothetical protein